MANVVVEPKRWLIVPLNIIERSALLRLPSKKWLTMRNMFVVPRSASNARILQEESQKNQIKLDDEMLASIDSHLQVHRHERAFPDWYVFNNNLFTPLPHQVDALKRVYPVDYVGLLMEMGTCKTRVAIDLMTAHFYERRINFVIGIAPLTVKVTTWVNELDNFSPCDFEFIDVDSDFDWTDHWPPKQDVLQWYMVGVEALSQGKTFDKLMPITKQGLPYGTLVDESTRIANHTTICTKAAFDLRQRGPIRMIMTGSEIKKNLEDLYSQFEFLSPDIIGVGDYYAFRNRYCIMGGYKGKQIVGYNHVDELMGLISPFVYQADKSILKLPPKLYQRREVKLTPEQALAYKKMKKAELEGFDVKNALKKTLRLQQITCGYLKTDRWQIDPDTMEKVEVPVETIEIIPPSRNPKLQELIKIAKEISHPMIIWSTSLYEIQIIEEALSKMGKVLKIIGTTPREERNAIVQEFQTGTVPFYVGTASAGGIGTTLTAARTVVYFSNNQMLIDRVQSEDRAHRKGQTHSVAYIDLVAAGTVDVSVLRNIGEKRELASYIKGCLRDKIALEKFFDGEVSDEIIKSIPEGTQLSADAEGLLDESLPVRRAAGNKGHR